MAEEKVFADGFSFKRNDNAPEFVVGKQSIKLGKLNQKQTTHLSRKLRRRLMPTYHSKCLQRHKV